MKKVKSSKGISLKKAALLAGLIVVLGVLAAPKATEMYLDHKAEGLVGTCYLTADQMLYFGLISYDKEANTFDMEGAVGGMLPIAGKVKRDGFLDALKKGEVHQEKCPSEQ